MPARDQQSFSLTTMRLAVIGGGGVGSYIAGLLAHHGQDMRLLTRGAHLDAIRTSGLVVRTPDQSYTVGLAATNDAQTLVGSDYAILTVKGYDLGDIAPVIRLLTSNGTTIVPLLNGVDIADRLAELRIAREQILDGLITISAVRTAAGIVERRSGFQQITIGEADGELSARAVRLGTALDEAGLPTRVSREIRLDLWRKFAFLTSLAAACALRRAPIGGVLSDPSGRHLLIDALAEVTAVGRAAGVAWTADDEARIRTTLESLPASMKPSLLVDLENGRPTEVDTLSGTIVRLGREHGIDTPVHARVVRELT
ncbi:MAG TPA: ketopantoate reductase family protein [Gemmatimonadaceae bacterium]